jgi:hypothetical protein
MGLLKFGIEGLKFCCKIANLDDWHHVYFCEKALVEHYQEIETDLSMDAIADLQNYLSQLDDFERWNYSQAIRTIGQEYL